MDNQVERERCRLAHRAHRSGSIERTILDVEGDADDMKTHA
jgi:hypothetical protein